MNQKQAKELVRSRLSDKRYEHTLNVKKMAVKLAKRYGVDEDKAALAALLHDSAKEISKDEMRELMRQYPQYAEGGEERPASVWHGICAAILARTRWGVEDEAILSAIACHTAGKAGMSKLGQGGLFGRHDQQRAGLAGRRQTAEAGNERPRRRHAGCAETDQRIRPLPGQAAGPPVRCRL